MTKRLILMLAVLAVTLPSGSRRALAATEAKDRAAAAAPADLTPAQVFPICDRVLVAAMNGSDAAAALQKETAAMPPEHAAQVRGVCSIFLIGAIAHMKHEQEAPKVPAGAAVSI